MSQPPRWILRWTPFSCYFVHSETQMKQKAKDSLALHLVICCLISPLMLSTAYLFDGVSSDILRALARVAFLMVASIVLGFVFNGLQWCIIAASRDRAKWIDDEVISGAAHAKCDHQWQLRWRLLDCRLDCAHCRKSRRVRGDTPLWFIAFALWYLVMELALNLWGGYTVFLLGMLVTKAALNAGHYWFVRWDVEKRGQTIEAWLGEG